MRDRKISGLLVVSFLLLLASFLILCVWGYNFYRQSQEEKIAVKQVDVPTNESNTRDSLLAIYTSSIKQLEYQLGNTWTQTDSLEGNLSVKLDEYYRLKNELNALLKSPRSSDDFYEAKIKINELQSRILELRNVNLDVSEENKRLQRLLAELNNEKTSSYVPALRKDISPVNNVSNTIPTFVCYELSLSAIKDAGEDAFTVQHTGKIVGSFVLQNNVDVENGEVMVVIFQPNGKVLQKSPWESGSFQTRDGKKIYSCKLNFEYPKGAGKKLSFTIESDKIEKGNYIMQLFHNGSMIGNITRMIG